MPDFLNPIAFLLFLCIPIIYFAKKNRLLSRFAIFSTISDWQGETYSWKYKRQKIISFIYRFLIYSGIILVILALADPVVYKQVRVYTSRGTDILFVLDVSPSMSARDISGNTRIDAAKNSVKNLVQENSGVSFGIVAMAQEASVVIPPTVDHELFLKRLNDIQIGFLGDGTALGIGLSTAAYHLASSNAPNKCIILITDGENNAGAIHPETAAELAKQNNITVYAMGVGSSGSVPIDYIDPKTGKTYSGYLNSTFDTTSLRKIAEIGQGRYFEIQSIDSLSLALQVISRNESSVQNYHTKTTRVNYYDRFLFVALILISSGWFIKRICLREFI